MEKHSNRTNVRTRAMRRMILTAAAVIMAIGAGAQNVEATFGAEGKMLGHSNEPQLIGYTDGSVVMTDVQSRKLVLASYDIDQNEKARVELGSSKEVECYGGFVNGDNVDLLLVNNGDGMMRVWRERRSLSTLQPVGDPSTLVDLKGEKKDKFYFTLGTSPSQELLAGVSVAARKGLDPEMRVSLYSRQLEAYWHMPISAVAFNQILVNDSGEVVLGHCTLDQRKACTFTVLDGENEKHFGFRLDSEIWPTEVSMVRYDNNKLILAVAVCEGHKVIMPLGSNINRIDFYCYDVEKDKLSITSHHISDLDASRLCGRKEGKAPNNNWVQFGNIVQSIADGQGAYLMLDQTWTVTRNDIPVEQNRVGMMVIRINADGKVQWTKSIRMGSRSSWGGRGMIAYRWRSTADGIALALAQHAKNASLTPDQPVKTFRIFKDKAILNVYTLNPKGELNRTDYNIGKQAIVGAARTVDSHNLMLFLIASANKGQFANITIK